MSKMIWPDYVTCIEVNLSCADKNIIKIWKSDCGRSVMYQPNSQMGIWCAKLNQGIYGYGPTAEEAMEQALKCNIFLCGHI